MCSSVPKYRRFRHPCPYDFHYLSTALLAFSPTSLHIVNDVTTHWDSVRSTYGTSSSLLGFTLPCPLSVVRCPLPVVRCPLSVVRCPLSAIRCPLSVVRYQVSAVRCPLSVVHCSLSDVRCRYQLSSITSSTSQCTTNQHR